MSHTPGPWEIDKRLSGYEVKAKDKNLWVCSVYGDSDNVDEADARLIAAAPDLLEELNALVVAVCFGGEPKTFNDVLCYEARVPVEFVEKARAAIAKARGQG